MVKTSDIENLLKTPTLQQTENTITNNLGCNLYKDDLSLLAGFLKGEIESSGLSLAAIEKFITDTPEEVITFSQIFWDTSKPQSLSAGIAITYGIYIIYLKEKTRDDLLQYIKKRRIPKAKKFQEQLLAIKEKMNL